MPVLPSPTTFNGGFRRFSATRKSIVHQSSSVSFYGLNKKTSPKIPKVIWCTKITGTGDGEKEPILDNSKELTLSKQVINVVISTLALVFFYPGLPWVLRSKHKPFGLWLKKNLLLKIREEELDFFENQLKEKAMVLKDLEGEKISGKKE